MAWYAYCITEQQTLSNGTRARRPFLMEGVQGVNDAPVLSYPSGEFAVIVSEYDRSDAKLEEAAQSYIDDMLATSPIGLRLTKDGLNQAINASSLEAAMAIENRNQLMCAQSPDFAEGQRAFLDKRRPVYSTP